MQASGRIRTRLSLPFLVQRFFCWFCCCLPTLSASNSFAGELTVFAAASLKESLSELAEAFQKDHGHVVFCNFGASTLLARQIEQSAPADIFFSADEISMDQLERSNWIEDKTRTPLLGNALVLVLEKHNPLRIESPEDLLKPGIKRIAIGEPRWVPAGRYAELYLKKSKLYSNLKSKLIPTENVRGALSAVSQGNADVAIVYRTDASISSNVRVVYTLPPSEVPEIIYSVAVLRESRQKQLALDFLKYIQRPASAEVFKKYGFIYRDPVKDKSL